MLSNTRISCCPRALPIWSVMLTYYRGVPQPGLMPCDDERQGREAARRDVLVGGMCERDVRDNLTEAVCTQLRIKEDDEG